MSQDDLYAAPLRHVREFQFDDQVAAVFPDMISRSVPGYPLILSMISLIAAKFVTPGSHVWDLGCSLGAVSFRIRDVIPADCLIHAVDNSEAMIRRLDSLIADSGDGRCRIATAISDIRNVQVHKASLVVLNFTLQFLPPEERDQVIRNVVRGMLPGGALLISEKLAFALPGQQQLMTELHHDFKRANGYSDLEISQKRTAIENCLIPESLDVHLQRLRDAGFSEVTPWFQCFNFASILAVR